MIIDALGNELKIGDVVLHFTLSGSYIGKDHAIIQNFEDDTVIIKKDSNVRQSRVKNHNNLLLISEIDRHRHKGNPSLAEAWKNYCLIRDFSSN